MRENLDIKYNSNSLLSQDDAATLLGSAFHPQDSRGEDVGPATFSPYQDSPMTPNFPSSSASQNSFASSSGPTSSSSNSGAATSAPSTAGRQPAPQERRPSPLPLDRSSSSSPSNAGFVYPHRRPAPRRQSSLSQPPPDGQPKTPRTSNRVRFTEDRPQVHEAEPLWNYDDENGLGSMNGTGNGKRRENTNGIPLQPLQTNGQAAAPSPKGLGIESPKSPSGPSDGRIRPQPVQRAWLDGEDPLTPGDDEEDFEEGAGLLSGDDVRKAAANHGTSVVQEVKSGLADAFFNMANSIIGAGIIGQPYALKQAGLAAGVVLLVSLTVLVDWTIRLIVVNSKMSGTSSFQGTVERCFGRVGLAVISISQWAFAFGGMVAFCVIVGDTIPAVIRAVVPGIMDKGFWWIFGDRRMVSILLIGGISYPLSLYRDIAKLAKASTLALISMLIIVITVITQGAMVDSADRGEYGGFLLINSGFFQAIGVISFAFVCHHNSLLIYGSLDTPTLDRFALVTHYSTFVSMLACLALGLGGFLSFGSNTKGNVLNNFPQSNIMVNVARVCFGLNMLTTLPLECFVCREVMNNYFWPSETEAEESGAAPFNTRRHVLITTFLVAGALGISLLTCDLGAVFELIGATTACVMAYVLPPACYLKLSKRQGNGRTRLACWACIVFGFAVMLISTTQTLVKTFSGQAEHAVCT